MDLEGQLVNDIRISQNVTNDTVVTASLPEKGNEEDELPITLANLVNVSTLITNLPCLPGMDKDENGTCYDIGKNYSEFIFFYF